jgi:hypothetical protein
MYSSSSSAIPSQRDLFFDNNVCGRGLGPCRYQITSTSSGNFLECLTCGAIAPASIRGWR